MSVTNGSGARIFCSSPLSTQQGEASTRRTIMFIHFLIGDKQKEITKTLRSICRLVWIRELLYTKILCFECLNPDILSYKDQYALGRIFWSFPKGRIDDGRIQLCTCYANEALYLKENFPKSSKLSFPDFPKLIGRNGTQVEIRYDKNYNWSGFPDLLPNQMEGYCTHISNSMLISYAFKFYQRMFNKRVYWTYTSDDMTRSGALVVKLATGLEFKNWDISNYRDRARAKPSRTQSRFNWDSQDQEGNRIPPISWKKNNVNWNSI